VLAFRIGSCHPFRPRRFPHGWHHGSPIGLVRVHEEGDHASPGNQLGKPSNRVWHQLGSQDSDAREVANRPGETATRPVANRVDASSSKISGSLELATLRRQPPAVEPTVVAIHVNLAADKIGGQGGRSS